MLEGYDEEDDEIEDDNEQTQNFDNDSRSFGGSSVDSRITNIDRSFQPMTMADVDHFLSNAEESSSYNHVENAISRLIERSMRVRQYQAERHSHMLFPQSQHSSGAIAAADGDGDIDFVSEVSEQEE